MTPLATLQLADRSVALRRARVEDVPSIVDLLADDPLGRTRESTGDGEELSPYLHAFEAIDADPGQLLVVAETVPTTSAVVATMQLTFIPGLSRRGRPASTGRGRACARSRPGPRSGRAMVGWAIEEARLRGCSMIQLTSDKQRTDAHRFYTAIGFEASHEGFKLRL